MFKNVIKIVLGLLLIGLVWWALRYQLDHIRHFTPERIRDYIQSFGNLAAVVYIFVFILNAISVLPPVAILSIASGLAFGKLWGSIYLMIAAMSGAHVVFFISRYLVRRPVERLLGGRFRHFDDILERRGFVTVFFFRVIPFIPYGVINYVAGLSKITARDFFWATFLGLIPNVVITSYFGGELGEVDCIRDLISRDFVIAAAVISIAVIIPIAYIYIVRKRSYS